MSAKVRRSIERVLEPCPFRGRDAIRKRLERGALVLIIVAVFSDDRAGMVPMPEAIGLHVGAR